MGETWLLVEPSVVFIMIILPRLLDEAMTPVSTISKDERSAREKNKRRVFKRPTALSRAIKPKQSGVINQ